MSSVEFQQSVDRRLVHRDAVAGVFVTSIRERPAHHDWVFGVQIPRHEAAPARVRRPRVRLLGGIEAMRQCTLATAHHAFGVPHGWAFTMQRLAFGWIAETPRFPLFGPISAAGRVQVVDHEQRRGVTTGLSIGFDLLDHSGLIASGAGTLRCIPPAVYRRIRRDSPSRIDRWDRSPVQGGVQSTDSLQGTVGWNVGDARIFDHDSDHLPGVALLDCAITAAEALTGQCARHVEMSFDAFTDYYPTPQFTAQMLSTSTVAVRITQDGTDTAVGQINVR